MNNVKTIFKIILFICLLVPFFEPNYGFYQFLRLSCTIGFAYLIFKPDKHRFTNLFIVLYVVGFILFQPFEKVVFEKLTWLVIDTIYSIILITDLIINKKLKDNDS
tara:strand:- start:920 stop:1237 length:318 start_codon:yes stop_codon:yes gene_type:complete